MFTCVEAKQNGFPGQLISYNRKFAIKVQIIPETMKHLLLPEKSVVKGLRQQGIIKCGAPKRVCIDTLPASGCADFSRWS